MSASTSLRTQPLESRIEEAAAVELPHRPRRSQVGRPRGFRPDVEGLRAVAVVAVVLYHAGLGIHGGYVGVDVFFVLSGFLTTRQLVGAVESGRISAIPIFYAHRIRRLVPTLVAVIAIAVLASRGLDRQGAGLDLSSLLPVWLLGVWVPYLVGWPIAVVLVAVIGRQSLRRLLTLLLGLAIVTSATLSVTVTAHGMSAASFETRAWEFAVGALVAAQAQALVPVSRKVAGLAGWIGLGAIGYAMLAYTEATPFPGWAAWLPVAGSALVLAAGCGPKVGVERFLGEPLMQCLGRVSFAWYLWHWPVLVIIPVAIGHDLGTAGRVGVVWISLVISIISYVAIEAPVFRISARRAQAGSR